MTVIVDRLDGILAVIATPAHPRVLPEKVQETAIDSDGEETRGIEGGRGTLLKTFAADFIKCV